MPGQLGLDISHEGGRATVAVSGDLDMNGTLVLEPRLEGIVSDARPETLVLDLRRVDFIDSVGLGLLLGAQHAAQAEGHRLEIIRPRPEVHRILELTGYDEVLPLVDG